MYKRKLAYIVYVLPKGSLCPTMLRFARRGGKIMCHSRGTMVRVAGPGHTSNFQQTQWLGMKIISLILQP